MRAKAQENRRVRAQARAQARPVVLQALVDRLVVEFRGEPAVKLVVMPASVDPLAVAWVALRKAARAVKAKQAARAQEKAAPADQVAARAPVKALERAQARLAAQLVLVVLSVVESKAELVAVRALERLALATVLLPAREARKVAPPVAMMLVAMIRAMTPTQVRIVDATLRSPTPAAFLSRPRLLLAVPLARPRSMVLAPPRPPVPEVARTTDTLAASPTARSELPTLLLRPLPHPSSTKAPLARLPFPVS